MALGKNIVITADTQQAIAEINKLDQSQSNLIASTVAMTQSMTGVGAAMGGISALAGGVIGLASTFHTAEVESGALWDQMNAKGGGALLKLSQETGFLISSQSLLAAQTVLAGQGLAQYTGLIGKAAKELSEGLGISEEEAMGRMTKMVATGKKVGSGFARLGLDFKQTGDKAADQAAIIEMLTKRYGDLNIVAATAEERAKAYATELTMVKAAAYNATGDVSAWEAITMNVTKAKDEMLLWLGTGLTMAEAKKSLENQQMVKTIQDETAAYTQQIDKLSQIVMLQNGTKEERIQAAKLAQSTVTDSRTLATAVEQEMFDQLEKLQKAMVKAPETASSAFADYDVSATSLFTKVRPMADSQLLQYGAITTKIEEMTTAYRKSLEVSTPGLERNNALLREKNQLLLDGEEINARQQKIEDAAEKAEKDRMVSGTLDAPKVDSTLVALQAQILKTKQMMDIKNALKTADANLAAQQYENAKAAVMIYQAEGKAAQEYFTLYASESEKKIKSDKDAVDKVIANALKIGEAYVKGFAPINEIITDDASRFKAMADAMYPDWAASGKLKFAYEDINKELKVFEYNMQYGTQAQKDAAGVGMIAARQRISDLQSETAWQGKLNEANTRKNSLLVYQGEAGDMAINTKSLELQLQQAEMANNEKLAGQLSAQINDIKAKNNEYGKLQVKLNEYGMAWTSLKTLTEGAFRGAGEAIMMSNAELAKAGKTRGQVIMSQLKTTLKALAIENIVKGGTKLAEAIGASVLTPALAPGLYASAAKHFAVAAFAGVASSQISAGGGPKAAGNTKDKNQSATTATQTSSNVNYVYNISNSMMLSNPDALVRNLNSMQRSYQERRV
jgi:hypothetical protein